MSKRPHGNKEAKKPKRVVPPVSLHPPSAVTGTLALPSGGQKPQRDKR